MQLSDIPYKFGRLWAALASASFITDPIPDMAPGPRASRQLGFPPGTATPVAAGGLPPDIGDFNGVFHYLSGWAQWQQSGGPVAYDAAFQVAIGGYQSGAVVQSATIPGVYWLCTADNNLTNPDASGAGWTRYPRNLFFTAGGTANALTGTFAPGPPNLTYMVGIPFFIKIAVTNTTSGVTLSLNGLTATAIQNIDGTAIRPFQLLSGATYQVIYDGSTYCLTGSGLQSGVLLGINVFNSNGTFTPIVGMATTIFEGQGGGGGGGGCTNPSVGNVSIGAPGTGGTFVRGSFTAAQIGASRAIIIGAAGVGVVGGAGTAGGTTSVGNLGDPALLVAPGGIAGGMLNDQTPPSSNGNGSYSAAPTITGGVNLFARRGTASSVAFASAIAPGAINSGIGGSSMYGDGGPGVAGNNSGQGAGNPGAGGGGSGINAGFGGSSKGGDGAAGRVVAYQYS